MSVKPFPHRAFSAWLTARGAQVLNVTNPYEVVRFKTQRGFGIVYRNDKGRLTFFGESKPAFDAYSNGESWDAGVKSVRKKRTARLVAQLIERDGDACFFCGKPIGDEATIEHLVPVGHGGPSHLSNLALAHRSCNAAAGHLPLMMKIKMRENEHSTNIKRLELTK